MVEDDLHGRMAQDFFDKDLEARARAWHAKHCHVPGESSYWPPNDEWWGRLWRFYNDRGSKQKGGPASCVVAARAERNAEHAAR